MRQISCYGMTVRISGRSELKTTFIVRCVGGSDSPVRMTGTTFSILDEDASGSYLTRISALSPGAIVSGSHQTVTYGGSKSFSFLNKQRRPEARSS